MDDIHVTLYDFLPILAFGVGAWAADFYGHSIRGSGIAGGILAVIAFGLTI